MKSNNTWLLPAVVALAPWTMPSVHAADPEAAVEEVVVTGTRREARSVSDSPVPVDVISGDDFVNQGTTDMNSLLSTLVPSYNVNTQPISDAATIMRPANLRGLPPDNTLVLVNGKRRHRGAVVAFLGGGIADGSQGPDLASIPAIALKQVEVLRDGASAQYGSDAIAGVLNFILKDDAEGGSVEARYGEFYEGDGESVTYSANIGLPLTDAGFANFSLELNDVEPTSRSVQREDAQTLIDAGNTDVRVPTQIWGSPEVRDDFKFLGNVGLDLGNGSEAYAFGNWSERTVEGGFFFRNPNTRAGVFNAYSVDPDGDDPDPFLLVADFTPGVTPCPVVNIVDNVPDAAALAQVAADPNCFAFNQVFPGGFTPQFGGDVSDSSFTAGVRGELDNSIHYDVSGSVGRSEVKYFINNTINPQLAALEENIPTSYHPGAYTELDRVFNVDLSYPLEIGGFSSPLNVAGGIEYREETFEITNGDPNSFYIDRDADLPSQGFGIGSNGFPGFKPQDAGSFSSDLWAAYLDLEADVTENLLLGAAVRHEDFSDFGNTTDFKLTGRLQVADEFAVRGAVSTGFRVPTAGQANVRNVTTAFTNGQLADEATLPPTNPISVQLGGRPLEPEESVSYTFGTVFGVGDVDVTIDYYNVEVTDRIALTTTIELTPQDIADLLAQGVADATSFTGVRFFVNGFDTTTQGVDIVATYSTDALFGGNTEFAAAANWTDTEVDDFIQTGGEDIIGPTRIKQLEENLPNWRANLSATHTQGPWRGLIRINYYGDYYEAHLDDGDLPIEAGEEITVDVELGYNFTDNLVLVAGAQNLFDEDPDKNPWATVVGSEFPATSPMGFNGGFWYARGIYQF